MVESASAKKELEFRASHNYARVSARKARLVANLVRGKNVNMALETLLFEHKRSGDMIEQLIHGAIQNANQYVSRALDMKKSNPRQFKTDYGEMESVLENFDADELFVKKIWVDEGPTLKRWQPRAMGRATPILKRMCHINVVLGYKISVVENEQQQE
ncbi:MAG: large ribosomal subunit protein uL22 [Planctomycetota bacterium]|jgi:large subunit ribosomal protein L22